MPSFVLFSQITWTETHRRLLETMSFTHSPESQRCGSVNAHTVEEQKMITHTSGLRLKAFAGFPTQRKSKMISFIAKSKRSCSEKEKTKQVKKC